VNSGTFYKLGWIMGLLGAVYGVAGGFPSGGTIVLSGVAILFAARSWVITQGAVKALQLPQDWAWFMGFGWPFAWLWFGRRTGRSWRATLGLVAMPIALPLGAIAGGIARFIVRLVI
jgi:hypothetical protein